MIAPLFMRGFFVSFAQLASYCFFAKKRSKWPKTSI